MRGACRGGCGSPPSRRAARSQVRKAQARPILARARRACRRGRGKARPRARRAARRSAGARGKRPGGADVSGRAPRAARATPGTAATVAPRAALPCASRPAFPGGALVERALEAVEHVVDVRETGLLQRETGVDRAVAAAADQHDRPVHAGDFLHLPDEMRVDLPVGPVVPGDVVRADRVADEEVLHLRPAVDEDGRRVLVQEVVRLARCQVSSWDENLARTRRPRYGGWFGGYNRLRGSGAADRGNGQC